MSEQPVATTYEDFMNAGHAAAWEENWERAIQAYSMAVRSRPDAPSAYNSLGLALLQVRPPRLQEALKVYQRAHDLDPDDPLPLEKSADVYERLGRLDEAAKQYLAVAEAYLAKPDLKKAIGNWERATRVTPGLIRVHQKLALAYERIGDTKQAVREYLTLAANFQRNKKTDVAIQAVERALRLEPRNPQALNMLQALRSGGELIYADERLKKDEEDSRRRIRDEHDEDEEDTPSISDANPKGPIGEAVTLALEQLALIIAETDLMSNPSAMHVLQAMEFHSVNAFDEAIGAYQRAEAGGMKNPALAICLGSLMIDRKRYKDAVLYLERAMQQHELQGGAHHGLGIAYLNIGKTHEATEHLIRAMQLVDVGLAISDEEVHELGAIYDRLLQNTKKADEIALQNLNTRVCELLTGVDWKQRVELTRHQLEDAVSERPESLLEVASVPPEIVDTMNRIDNHIQSRRFIMAMDEAYYVVEKQPDYIPAHMRIGQILVLLGQLELAAEKYRRIADTYLARGNKVRASEILNEVIKLAPMDTELRQDLIALLEEEERWNEIVDQYISLANAYIDLADANNARNTLNQALQVAQRYNVPRDIMIKILHLLADVEMTRLQLRPALRAYENIKNLEPEDTRAREMIIDLNFRLGDPVAAIKEMDTVLQIYAKRKDGRSILKLLESWAEKRKNDEAIHSRLAAVYVQIKRPDAALAQYKALLELQIGSHRTNEACDTIKKILTLKPSDAQQYMKLAKQIGCG